MKSHYFIFGISFLIIITAQVTAQDVQYPYADKQKEMLFMNEHDNYMKGDTITFGVGTIASGDFQYVTKSLARIGLTKGFAGGKAVVRGMKYQGTPKKGLKFILLLKGEGVEGYEIDIRNALASGEVVSKAPAAKTIKRPAGYSTADEIRKLKALLDEGIITQEEFDAEKKKVLE